jgi:cyclopropane fatty-acyl-phospholipid synthase-like methyltransferase
MASPRYDDREAMAPPPDHRWTLLLEQIPARARVLELGCGRGYAPVAMARKGCTVAGFEIDAEAAAEASRHCDRVHVGDPSEVIASEEITHERFDVSVADDVEVERFLRHRVGDWDEYIAILRRRRQPDRAEP